MFCYLYFALYQASEIPIKSIWAISVILFCPILFLIEKKYIHSVCEKYCIFFAISIIPSLLVYFLVVWGDCSLPYEIIEPLNELKNNSYFRYPFCIIPDTTFRMRFCGYYDEPGVVGTIAGILLIINEWNLKKIRNIPLVIAGIFSFSLFFYILSILYFLFLSSSKKGKLFFLITIIIASFLLYDNREINQLIFSRMEVTDNGLSGDNRTTDSFDYWYKGYFVHSDYFLLGFGKGKSVLLDPEGCSYKHLIVDYGIVFTILFYILVILFYYYYCGISRRLLICIYIFVSVMFQRPTITNVLYLFLLIAPVCSGREFLSWNAD